MACPRGAKARILLALSGTAEEVGEKLIPGNRVRPQRLKPNTNNALNAALEALRHPKSNATLSFSAASEAVPFPKP
jgi:hypothetical protein